MNATGSTVLIGFGGPARRLLTLGLDQSSPGGAATPAASSVIRLGFGGPAWRVSTLGFGGSATPPPTFSEWFVSPERQSAGDWDHLTVE